MLDDILADCHTLFSKILNVYIDPLKIKKKNELKWVENQAFRYPIIAIDRCIYNGDATYAW